MPINVYHPNDVDEHELRRANIRSIEALRAWLEKPDQLLRYNNHLIPGTSSTEDVISALTREMRDTCRIYGDGSADEQLIGGWAYVIKKADVELGRASGAERGVKSSRMELAAIVEALSCVREQCAAVFTDNPYVTQVLTKTSDHPTYAPRQDTDLVLRLKEYVQRIKISSCLIRRNSTAELRDCHQMANKARKECRRSA